MTLRIPLLLLFSVKRTCFLLIYFIVFVIVFVVVKIIFALYSFCIVCPLLLVYFCVQCFV
jgi:hypothetical protein